MSVNSKFQNNLITGEDWRQLARSAAIDPDEMTSWVYEVVSNAPDALADAVRAEGGWIAGLDLAHHLVDGVATTSKALLRWIESPASSPLVRSATRPAKPFVAPYRKADGTWVRGYPNPRHRG